MTRKDWFSFTIEAQRADLAAEYLAGPKPLQKMGAFWGDGVSVICAGDEHQAQACAARVFHNKFHAKPCPKGLYGDDHGGHPLPSVYDRLAADGYFFDEVHALSPQPT